MGLVSSRHVLRVAMRYTWTGTATMRTHAYCVWTLRLKQTSETTPPGELFSPKRSWTTEIPPTTATSPAQPYNPDGPPCTSARRQRSRPHQHLPVEWTRFAQRASAIGRGREARKASDPTNALLNYAYRLLEVEATLSCQRLGLDPGLGVLHRDRRGRDSMSLDLIEPVRPDVDRWVLELLEGHTFTRDDFVETREGQVRLTHELAEVVTEMMPVWAASIAPHAESVSLALVDQADGQVRRRTPLTGKPKSSSRRRTTPVPTPAPVPRYVDCGAHVATHRQKRCANCNGPHVTALAHARAQRARDSLAKTRASGQDPTTTTEALRKRAASVAANHVAMAGWQTAHPDQTADPDVYWTQIQPFLGAVSVSQIRRELGVSPALASKMRAGSLLPHVRHWDAPRALPNHPTRRFRSDLPN
jgi:hypothetical protein